MPRTQVEARYKVNRQHLLDEAGHLFAAKGFPRTTTIVELARACACSKALLYHYFALKEGILYALLKMHPQNLCTVAEAFVYDDVLWCIELDLYLVRRRRRGGTR